MSEQSGLPLIAIITPFIFTFIVGLIKDRYIKVKKVAVVIGCLISLSTCFMMIKDVFINGDILTYNMGGFTRVNGESIGISLYVDSLSLLLGIIITCAALISAIYSLKYMEKDNGLSKYYMLFLLLVGSMIGFVFTGDLFNMYVMLEIMTISAIALTAFRNDKWKALESSFKYTIIGGLGSSFILIGTVLLYMETHTLNIRDIANRLMEGSNNFSAVTILSFSFLIVGYAVKAFMVPCHTWPPDAHMSAPSSISMILSGIMSKTGIYAVIRILFIVFSLTGNKGAAYFIVWWGVITMVVGVSMALIQSDFKRLLAFHSVSQIGYIVVGIGIGLLSIEGVSNEGLSGGIFHMINHASFKCLLFLCAGAILYKTGTTNLDEVSGAGREMPFTMIMFLIGALSISGIPPFNGFSSKWILYTSSYSANMPFVTIFCLVVSVMTLASFMKVFHTVFLGRTSENIRGKGDIPFSMKLPLFILSIICVALGLFSNTVVKEVVSKVVSSIKGLEIDLIYDSPYSSKSFLLLLLILIVAIILFMKLKIVKGEKSSNVIDSKYETFYCGESENYENKLGAHDIFWGMKYEFRIYFEKIKSYHSGSVNDYVLWVIGSLSLVIIISLFILKGGV